MTAAQYHRIKGTMGALKRWAATFHRAKDYARRNALCSRYDELAIKLFRGQA
jgi:hypothetical protein